MNNQHLSVSIAGNSTLLFNILCPDQQQEIESILQQTTIIDHNYTDQEINHLLNPKIVNNNQRPSVKNSIHSQFSAASESDENQFLSREPSLGEEGNNSHDSDDSEDGLGDGLIQGGQLRRVSERQPEDDINQILVNQFLYHQNNPRHPHQNLSYKSIYQQMQQLQTPYTLQRTQKQYPSFFISKPMYKLEQTARQKKIALGNVFNQFNVTVVDVGSIGGNRCFVVAGTDSNCVLCWEVGLEHMAQVIEVFGKQGQGIEFVKWSPSMKYICVSSTLKQVKLLQLAQSPVQQFPQHPKPPAQVFTLTHPRLKSPITYCHFIQQHPLKLLLVDQQHQIHLLQMRKQFLSVKPYINKLPIKFNLFSQLRVKTIYGQKGQFVTILIVGGEEYVTFAIIQPKFEIVLVFDKEKHFPSAKRGGFPHVMFMQSTDNNNDNISNPSLQVLIAWDKHMQLIRLTISDLDPFTYKIQTLLKYSFPDSTILLGNLSDTLIYQLTRVELKIYSINQLMRFNLVSSNSIIGGMVEQQRVERFARAICSMKVNFQQFPQGGRIEQMLSNQVLDLSDLHYIQRLISTSNDTLFLCFSHYIYTLSIYSFTQFIQSTIQSINDWKIGLQLLNDGILHQITCFDNMKQSILRRQLREYSSRYIQFLKGVIPDCQVNNQIWKQQMCFLFNIMISANEQGFLLKEILMKLYRLSPQLLRIFQPFILMGKITEIQVDTLDLLLSVIDNRIGRKLIYCIKNSFQLSQDHNQLAHLINNILIRYEFYLQMIWINQYFSDYYTPFVVLISKFEKQFNKKQPQIVAFIEQSYYNSSSLLLSSSTKQQTLHNNSNNQIVKKELLAFNQQKGYLVKLLSFLSFDTLRVINESDYGRLWAQEQRFHVSRVKAKYLLQTLIPIMHLKLNQILIRNCPQQFFDFILEEFFHGNCLDILNQLSSYYDKKKNYMKEIIANIPFRTVMQQKQQRRYWLLLIRLMIRKISLSTKIFSGLYYLTLQCSDQSPTLIALIDIFAIECAKEISQEFQSIQIDQKIEYFEKLKCTEYMELLKLMGKLLNREIEVLECIIPCGKCHTVSTLQYMTVLLTTTTPSFLPTTLSKLKQFLKQNIPLFTSIDPSWTSNFIINHYKQQMKQFISYLSSNPKQQLKLLKQILIHYNYGQFLNSEKRRYLQLLAITGERGVILGQVKSHMFPLDDAIEICKKFEVLDAWAYLLVKSGGTGNSKLAIQIYFRLMKQHISYYKYNRKTSSSWLSLRNLMLQQLRKYIIQSSGNEEMQWFFIIEQLQILRKYVYKSCSPEVEENVREIILQVMYPELVAKMLDQVPIQIIQRYLKASLNNLQPQTAQLIIEYMVKSCQSQKMILKNAQQEISQCQIQQRKILLTQTIKGFITSSRCYQCMRRDIDTKIHYYSCGHDIHPVCNQDVKECISCKFYQQTMIWKFVNIKDKVEKIIYYNPIDPEKDKTQREITRLSRQQKLKQFDDTLALVTYNFVGVL